MQPQDVRPSGKQDLCDGCPNKTVHNGRLVSICRTEEYIRFGDMVTLKKKNTEKQMEVDELISKEINNQIVAQPEEVHD